MRTNRAWTTSTLIAAAILAGILWPLCGSATGPSLNGQLLLAAQNGSLEQIKRLLAKGADVNAKNRYGRTALVEAVRFGRVEAIRLLLHNGADVTAGDALSMVIDSLEYPSSDAVSSGQLKACLDVVKLLLERGADVNSKDLDKRKGPRTALVRFSAEGLHEVVKLLLEHGADVNATLNDGSNALFCAMWGRDYSFDSLCVKGLKRQKERNWSRSSVAVPHDRRSETVRLLVTHGIDVNAKLKSDSSTALSWAAFLGEAELARLLLDKGAKVDARLTDGRTPLFCAVTSCLKRGTLRTLGSISESANELTRSKFGIMQNFGSLSEAYARRRNSPALEMFFEPGQVDVARLLLDRDADVNARLSDRATALFWASILGKTEMVKLLLERGADANAALTDGSTVLQWATLYERPEVVKLLTEHGGKRNLAAAAMSGLTNEVRRLLDEGSDVNVKDGHGTTALMECARRGYQGTVGLLIERGADVRANDEKGWTALNEALWNDHLDVAALLLDRGADPNGVDQMGWTALIHAAWRGRADAVNLLIARGANIRARDGFGKTACMRAAEMGHRDVAALLLDKGADVKAAETDGWTPMMTATAWGDRKTAGFLRERGAGMTVASAALLGDEKEVRRLVKEAARNRSHIPDATLALLIATKAGREDMVTLLLDRCPDIDIKAPCSDTAFLFAIEKRYTGIAKALLKKGANVHAEDDWGKTPLHHAALVDDLSLVHALVEKGADVNARAVDNTAPLAYALGRNPNVKLVKFLLEKGASVHAADNFDFTAEIVRSGNKEVIELLRAHGLEVPR